MRIMRKSPKRKYCVLIEEDIADKLEELAVDDYRSVSSMLNLILRRSIFDYEKNQNDYKNRER